MFIKAYASGSKGNQTNRQFAVNTVTGVNRGENPMSRYYRRGGTTQMGGNSRTRGRGRTLTRVGRGR